VTDVLTPVLSKNWDDEKSWTLDAYENTAATTRSARRWR
jgi:hypothetical protein